MRQANRKFKNDKGVNQMERKFSQQEFDKIIEMAARATDKTDYIHEEEVFSVAEEAGISRELVVSAIEVASRKEVGKEAVSPKEVSEKEYKYLSYFIYLFVLAVSVISIWTSFERESFLSKPWYQPVPFETTADKVYMGLLGGLAVLESIFLFKFIQSRYPKLTAGCDEDEN
jgi:hypothetical protein